MDLPAVTAAQIWLHMAHRIGAGVVTVAILLAAGIVLLRHRADRVLFYPAIALIMLLAMQIALGAATVLYRKPADVASAHVAVGALILVTTFILTVRAVRLFAKKNPRLRRASRWMRTTIAFEWSGVTPLPQDRSVVERR
jgi:heme A synthase